MVRPSSGWRYRLRAIGSSMALAALCLTGFANAASAQSQREYIQTIYLSGFKCTSIQRDSIISPSNEVFFVVVTNAPESSDVQGQSIGTFKGVKAGFGRKARNSVWSGVQQPLSLRVLMFERDAGGETGASAARTMVKLVVAYAGRSGEVPNRDGSVLRKDEQAEPGIVGQFGRGISKALGLTHDSMGYDRQVFGRGDWSSKPTYQERDIRYHFHTTHRQGGANCRAYFLIERGQEVKQPERPPPPEEIQSPAPGRDYYEPQPDPYNDPYGDPAGPPPYDELPPPPPDYDLPPPPPPPEPDWFRVRFKNLCDVPISLSYAYKNPSRGWVKRGWANFDAGEAIGMEGNTLTPEIYIYSSSGRVSGSFDPEVIELAVRKNGFDVDRSTSFQGDQGARLVPYSLHVLSDVSGTELIAIRDCDDWMAGELSSTQEPQRVPAVLPYTLGETHNGLKAPHTAEPEPVTPKTDVAQPNPPQEPVDLSGLDERCRRLVAAGMARAEDCAPPN
ncbi:hypothetical protein [Altererythrobacter sp. MF3-039]|uniref:hypothetical protein n=1 Tax=Altererythrobacter sp. MF3-039 TaxID=3252901 RepID=UPI00390C6389